MTVAFEHLNVEFQTTSIEVKKKHPERRGNDKSPEPGGVNLELLKYGGKSIIRILTQLYNRILAGDPMPQELKKEYLLPIFKKGDKKLCSTTIKEYVLQAQ